MTAQWSRENDALIARVAEGLEVEWHRRETLHPGICIDVGQEDFCVRGGEMAWQKENWTPISHYLTDLTACVRASEAWCCKAAGQQIYRSMSSSYEPWHLENRYCEELYEQADPAGFHTACFKGHGNEKAAALAWALYFACGGESGVKTT